jgi:F-type H+-transporting ATPase subunit a
MIPDIFSSFDPHLFKSFVPTTSLILIINLILINLIITHIHSFQFRLLSLKTDIKEIIYTQLIRTFSFNLKGFSSIISPIFIIIIIINLLGITPYLISLRRHLIITFSFGLPLWLSLIISSFIFNRKESIAHFLPDGAPDWLNPFLVIIESVRVIVRPLTLSFRLAANITAGHIVLGLIGIYRASSLLSLSARIVILIPLIIGYTLFEFGICLIQAYIFCLLITLYSDDHASINVSN